MVPELGHLMFGNFNKECKFIVPRDTELEDVFYKLLNKLGAFNIYDGMVSYFSGVYDIRPYYWGDSQKQKELPNFLHEPTQFKMTWYKYPLRDAYSNRDWTREQYLQFFKSLLKNA